MARSIWKGTLSFGLINVPVELYGAVRDHRPRFRLLHARDQGPIKYDHVCQAEGRPVSWQDLVKGYEYEKGKFVVLTQEDFQTAALERSKTIDILDFVRGEEIDDRYFVTPYYLLPGKGGERAYALLRAALRQTGRVGIAKIILRDAQHLVALDAIGAALVLTTLRFADELIDTSDYKFPPEDLVRERELAMAKALVESLGADFDPGKYTDEYRENLMRIVAAKVKGKRAALKPPQQPEAGGEVIDLMERLRRSLEGKPAAAPRSAAPRARPASRPHRAAPASRSAPRPAPARPS